MTTALAILAGLLLCAAVSVVLILLAPEGWEDADGWHPGEPGEGE